MKKIFTVAVFTILFSVIFAQSNVKLMDLSIVPYYSDSVVVNNQNQELGILFKMNKAHLAQQVHVLFGTGENQSNIALFQATITENAGLYYVNFNGAQEAIINYSCKINIVLTTNQVANYTHVTLYVTDINGNESNRFIFEK